MTKNGIRILLMNGCTTTVDEVIISCQYSDNSINVDIVKGNESSLKATDTFSDKIHYCDKPNCIKNIKYALHIYVIILLALASSSNSKTKRAIETRNRP